MTTHTPPNYADYLQIDQLLSLQGGLERDDSVLHTDELHFIVVHQVFELWFKLVLREMRLARDNLAAKRVPEETIPLVVHHLRRVNAIVRLGVDQFGIMETLTPQDFLSFRDKLVPASGFQSFQMREVEILMGLKEADRYQEGNMRPMEALRSQAETSPAAKQGWERVQAAQQEQTLRSALHDWLLRTPINGSSPGDEGDADVVAAFVDAYVVAHGRAQDAAHDRLTAAPGTDAEQTSKRMAAGTQLAHDFLHAKDVAPEERERVRRLRAGLLFVESYRDLPLLAWPRLLVDAVVELEENMVIWRTRHARMVERVIGRRVGTGGSSGVDYLDATARYRIFTELWTVRSILLAREHLPPLTKPEFYGFASPSDEGSL